jgi:hypothetical protein
MTTSPGASGKAQLFLAVLFSLAAVLIFLFIRTESVDTGLIYRGF